MSVVVKVNGAVAQPRRGDGFLSRLWSGAELLRVAKDAHYRTSPRWHDMAAGFQHRHDTAATNTIKKLRADT